MAIQIQIRRDLAANWTAANPTLAQGELGYELDTGFLKIGDGSTDWNTLAYFTTGGGEANTASNLGTGEGLFASKVGVDLRFKGLKVTGASLGISSTGDSVTIDGPDDTDDLAEGSTNRYYSSTLFDADFSSKDTDDLAEGASNFYFTSGRFDTEFASKTTSDLLEGSNLYYTEARVSANTDVAQNTASRHDAATVSDTADIDMSISGQEISGVLTNTGVAAGTYINATVTVDAKGRVTSISAGTASVYGTEFNLFESNPISVTTSTAGVTKISGNTTSLPNGTYKVTISYGWSYDANDTDFIAQASFDGTFFGINDTDIGGNVIHRQEPKDSGGNDGDGRGTNQKFKFSSTYYVTVTTPGVKAVLLRFEPDSGGVEAAMWDANIEIIRVS